MLTIREIRRRMAEIREELAGFAPEGDDVDIELTAEDEARYAELNTEFDGLQASLDAHEARMTRVRGIAAQPANRQPGAEPNARAQEPDADFIGEPGSEGRSGLFKNPWDLSQVQTWGRTSDQVAGELRARCRSAIEQMPQMTDQRRETLTMFLERYDNPQGDLARQVLVSSSPEYLRAWSKIMRGQGELLDNEERVALANAEWAVRAMSTTDNAGGYMIPQQLDPTLILTSDGSVNAVRQLCRNEIALRDVWNTTSTTHASWSYDGEGTQVSDDATVFAPIALTIYKAAGYIPISLEALGDIPNVAESVAMILAKGKDDLEAVQFATGSGGAPQGIVTALTGTGSVIASAAADTFAVGDVEGMVDALPAKYRRKGGKTAWLGNQSIYTKIRQFGSADSHALWERLANDLPEGLLGYPHYEASAMDGSITAAADNYVLILGDWDNYVIADRLGMTVEYIPQVFGANGRPTGQRGWYAYVRHGADSVNDGGFRMLNVT